MVTPTLQFDLGRAMNRRYSQFVLPQLHALEYQRLKKLTGDLGISQLEAFCVGLRAIEWCGPEVFVRLLEAHRQETGRKASTTDSL